MAKMDNSKQQMKLWIQISDINGQTEELDVDLIFDAKQQDPEDNAILSFSRHPTKNVHVDLALTKTI